MKKVLCVRLFVLIILILVGCRTDNELAKDADVEDRTEMRDSSTHDIIRDLIGNQDISMQDNQMMDMDKASTGAFIMVDDIVVIEIESALLVGDWKREMQHAGYTGASYYRWDSNADISSSGSGVLSYPFTVTSAGTYDIRIHCHHRHTDATMENDVFVKIDNGAWIKSFNSKKNVWDWQTTFEYSHNDKRHAAIDLSAGNHMIQLSGRSKNFMIDRIHIYKQGKNNAIDTSLPESERAQ